MAFKISAGNLVTNHYLIVESDGVKFAETSIGGARWFRFSQIDCILMSADSRLSFQVGNEVFSIPTDPANAKHQEVIAALVHQVKQANGHEDEST